MICPSIFPQIHVHMQLRQGHNKIFVQTIVKEGNAWPENLSTNGKQTLENNLVVTQQSEVNI